MEARAQRLPPSERVEIRAHDGVVLAADCYGAAASPPVMFAHGFGQSRHAWQATACTVADHGFRTWALDGRGHGESGRSADGAYAFDQFIDDVGSALDAAGSPAVWVGASMGGLLGMVAASRHPERFRALVLVDITPRWETAGVERILGFMRARPEGFASLDEAQAAVRDYLPHRAQAKSPERLAKLLVRGDDGRLRWHWDPRLLDTVAAETARWAGHLPAAARALRMPVLLISGGRSDVVSDHTIDEFLELVPHAEHRRLPDATHMVAGDANDRFTGLIVDWLDQLSATTVSNEH